MSTEIIKSGDYTISAIKRKSDEKIFKCYFRNGSVQLGVSGRTSWWISDDHEELLLHGVRKEFEVLDVISEKYQIN
jgi:hypothetical protein